MQIEPDWFSYRELARLREYAQQLAEMESRAGEGTEYRGDEVGIARTCVDETYPQTPNAFYTVEFLYVTGKEDDEEDGSQAIVTPTGIKVLAYNMGNAIPPVGSPVVVITNKYRFLFEWWG